MKISCTFAALMFCSLAHAGIGTVSELQGTAAELKRGSKTQVLGAKSSVESNDTIITKSATSAGITFADNTRVKVSENSRLVLDDFVYDPKNSDAGRLGMKVALGTVRYASGQIAKTHRQGVDIRTPTATVAVRGTDFAMTVDEVGRSLVVLLPSCADDRQINNHEIFGNCTVGSIDVITDAGFVTLTQPFTATYVADGNSRPFEPVVIDRVLSNINNDAVLKLPKTIADLIRQFIEKKYGKQELTEEERSVTVDDSNANDVSETTVMTAASAPKKDDADSGRNHCFPFTSCYNERGLNHYLLVDEERKNIIRIASGERMDNTTYNVSINSNDVGTRITGDGSNQVTVRQWSR